jgi:hypothetical protein
VPWLKAVQNASNAVWQVCCGRSARPCRCVSSGDTRGSTGLMRLMTKQMLSKDIEQHVVSSVPEHQRPNHTLGALPWLHTYMHVPFSVSC